MGKLTSRKTLFLMFLSGGFFAHIAALAYSGTYGRYLADDYCHAEVVLREGIIGSIAYWYTNWSGRFVNFALLGMIDTWGRPLAPFIPALVLMAWLTVFTWSGYQLFPSLRIKRPLPIALITASLILYGTLVGKVSVLQSLFWMPGLVGYSLALIWLTFYAGLLIYSLRHTFSKGRFAVLLLISAFGTFVAGGTSEVYDLFQITIFGMTSIGFLLFASGEFKRRGLWMLGVAMLGAILALIIMLAAPGNAIRQAELGTPLPLHLVALRTFLTVLVFITSTIAISNPIPVLVVLITSTVIFSRFADFDQLPHLDTRKVRQLLGLAMGIAFVLIIVCVGPPIYSTSAAPDARLLFIPQFILICTIAFCGSVVGLSLRGNQAEQAPAGNLAATILVLLVIIGPIRSAITTLTQEVPAYQVFANEWDTRDQAIRAAATEGVQHVEVNALTVDLGQLAGLEGIGADANHWVNNCAARYYGVASLRALEHKIGS